MIIRFLRAALLVLVAVLAGVLPPHAHAASRTTIFEYYNANLDHYFITADPIEMAALDNGHFVGWTRTGHFFETYTPEAGVPGLTPVCRFYGRPEAGLDSHFYSGSPAECAAVLAKYSDTWILESLEVFDALLPNTTTGACAADTMPVYRLFNNRADANHRYTTDPAVRAAMVLRGYIAEGYGPDQAVLCAPVPAAPVGSKATISVATAGPETYTFVGSAYFGSTEVANSFTWSFGDSTAAIGAAQVHRYPVTGMHRVVLTVKGSMGTTLVANAVVNATVTTAIAPPTASIVVTPIDNATFAFSSIATSSPGTTVVDYGWSFGDGMTGSGATATHTYTRSGNHQVVLWVRDNKGMSATATKTVTATVPVYAAPTATIAATVVNAATMAFDAVASAAPGLSLTSYAWNFGDGKSGTGSSVSHTYSASGSYQVALTVVDSNGKTATATRAVTITLPSSPPPATPPPNPAPTPIVGAPGTWTKYNISYTAGNEAEYQSWYNLDYDSKRDVFYGVSWDGVIAAFSPTKGGWTKLSPSIGGGVHNRTLAYDPVNDRVWLGEGTGSQLTNVNYFDPVGKAWVSYPMPNPRPGNEAAMIYDPAGKRFIVFGGWTLLSVKTFSLSPLAGSMVDAGITGGPAWDSAARKMTAWRSALDTKRNRIFYVDTDGSLWFLPLPLTGWQHVTPGGAPPPAYTQYVYDAANDAIVGYSASPRVAVGDDVQGTTRETWLLPFSTMTWTKAASAAGGQNVPGDSVYVGYAMAYDPVRKQTLLHLLNNSANFDPTTWAYRYPTGGAAVPPSNVPPPASPPAAAITATATASDTYRFDAAASAASGLAIASYSWAFGDGGSATGASVTHRYAASGTYLVALTVTDSGGGTTTVTKSVSASVPVVMPPSDPPAPPPPAPPPGNAPTYTGSITSFPLPDLGKSAPFSSAGSSKHTNMASDGRRIYVSGGDWLHSATDGTWSMSLADGSWRQDVGAPVYPTLPAPHALQDGAGFAWVANRQQFLLWPGSYFAYEAAGSPILEYAKGMWWLDPGTNTYTQDLSFFGTYMSSTGSPNGGIFDEANEHIVAFGDSSTGFATRRWDVNSMVRLPDIPFSVSVSSPYAAYFTRTKHVKIGRDVYIVGFRTNGSVSSQTPMLLRWNLDTQKMVELAPPPVDGTLMRDLEIRLATSHGKVVWPFMNGPEGNLMGIWIYDPAANVWKVDTQVPGYGNFIANSVTSLPDGRVALSGGGFGKQQTHMWFYEAQ